MMQYSNTTNGLPMAYTIPKKGEILMWESTQQIARVCKKRVEQQPLLVPFSIFFYWYSSTVKFFSYNIKLPFICCCSALYEKGHCRMQEEMKENIFRRVCSQTQAQLFGQLQYQKPPIFLHHFIVISVLSENLRRIML